MAGGIGSRFWPLSTPEHPKQFLDVLGIGKTLIQMTYERLLHVSPKENIYILTNEKYKDLVLEQLPELNENQILTEPQRKNTAPCIAYAAGKIYSQNKNACLIISPADHLIIKEHDFANTVKTAIKVAQKEHIVTIGIPPSRPDTGYGYIEVKPESQIKPNTVFPVIQFREKPDLETAKSFLQKGNFLWNAGIFIWKASTIIQALQQFQPELYRLFIENLSIYHTEQEYPHISEAFDKCEDISIDFAVMEHAKNIEVVVAVFDWSDLGTWGSLEQHLPKDENNNACIGGKIVEKNMKNCIVNIPKGNEALIDGLENYIIIQTNDKLMILKKEDEQKLKQFLKDF